MDLSEIIIRFANDTSASGWRLLFTVAALIGIASGIHILLRFAHETSIPGNYANVRIGQVMTQLIICAMLVQLSAVISATSHTFLSAEVNYAPIQYSASSDFGRFADSINAVLTLVKVIGGLYSLRALLSLKRAAVDGHHRSDDMVMRSIIQLCFGAALVQIDKVLDVTRASLNLYW